LIEAYPFSFTGIIHAEGEHWSEQRRFALRTLRDYGFGKSGMAELILDEVTEFMDWLRKENGAAVDPKPRLRLSVVNALWKVITGERYSHDDPKLQNVLTNMDITNNLLLKFSSYKSFLCFFYPKIAKMIPNLSGWNEVMTTTKPKFDLFDAIIKEHDETLQIDSPRDFIDCFLQEVRKTTDPSSSFNPKEAGKDNKQYRYSVCYRTKPN
jgi:hypothetical protein